MLTYSCQKKIYESIPSLIMYISDIIETINSDLYDIEYMIKDAHSLTLSITDYSYYCNELFDFYLSDYFILIDFEKILSFFKSILSNEVINLN